MRPVELLLAAIVLGVACKSPAGLDSSGRAKAEPANKLTLAVLPFHDKSEDPSLKGAGESVADFVAIELGLDPTFTLVERARLAEVMQEMRLNSLGIMDPNDAARVGRLLGASHVVMGTIARLGESRVLTARIVRVESGQIVGGSAENFYSPEHLSETARTAAIKLLNQFR